jgi:hypothetical protein
MKETPKPDPSAGGHLTPAEQHAWWIYLDAWVTRLRRSHEHLWPPPATSAAHREHGRVRQRPWPECWRGHLGLVHLLEALRAWHSELVRLPLTDETARAFVEWHTVVEQVLAREVQTIAKYCANGHRGPNVVRPKTSIDFTGTARPAWSDHLAGDVAQHERSQRKRGDHPASEGLT